MGSCTLTLLHESMRRLTPDAPRMDVLGMRALAKGLRKAGQQPPTQDQLFGWTMAGDLVGNALYYSVTGTGKSAWGRGIALGFAAGIGAVILPGPLGLGEGPSNRSIHTKVMTVGLYLCGGLAAAAASRMLCSNSRAC